MIIVDTELENTPVFEEINSTELNSWQDIALDVGVLLT